MSIEFVKRFVPNLSKEAEKHITFTSDEEIKNYAKNTNNHIHINKLINHPNFIYRASVASNPNLKKDNIEKLLKDPEEWVGIFAATNINTDDSIIEKILDNHPSIPVRSAAARNPNISKENLLKALKIKNAAIRISAKFDNPRYKEYFPNGHE